MNPKLEHYTKINEARKHLARQAEIERQELLKDAEESGIAVVHVFDPSYPKGGLTVAFCKTMPEQTSTNMVACAVATCSTQDNFDRKIGTQLALIKFFDGETIQLPLSSGHADEDLRGRVKQAFTALYNVVNVY